MRVLYGAALLGVLGFIMHRLNVSFTAFEATRGHPYVPTLWEAAATLMFITIGFLAFRFAARHLRVFPHGHPPSAKDA